MKLISLQENRDVPVTKEDILAFLSCFKNVDDLLQYNCPTHLQLTFNDSAENAFKSQEIPDYKDPSPIHVSTMTTTAFLSLKRNLNLHAFFYFMPCYSPLYASPTPKEISMLKILPATGKRQRKKKVDSHSSESSSVIVKKFTKALMSSNWVLRSDRLYCPLTKFYKTFCQYYTDRINRISGKEQQTTISYEEWREHFINLFSVNDEQYNENERKDNIYIEKVFSNIYYPKKQQIYEKSIATKTEFYDPKLYPYGSEFIFGCDVNDIFPTIIDNRFKGMLQGDSSVSAKKKASKTTFDNQCTMRIANENLGSKINTKLFVNGKLQMTGCKSIESTEKAIRYLIHESEIASYYRKMFNNVVNELKVFQVLQGQHKFKLPNEILELVFLNIDSVSLAKIMTVSKQFYNVINYDLFWVKRIEKQFKYKIRQDENRMLFAYERYQSRSNAYKKLSPEIPIKNPIAFYCELNKEKLYKDFVPLRKVEQQCPIEASEISVQMINSNFDAHFNINQEKLVNILKSYPYNLFVTFDTHPAINVKYVGKDDHGADQEITLLIFRTGNIIITGVKSYRLLHETYEFINGVLKEHYYDIWQPPDDE